MSDVEHSNHLAGETSPYLLQHMHNPVDWYPWGDAALARARTEGKPVLLSIGYAACHWCHVMAHESFEDPATAALMNRLYVNIKVDREERPDLDRIYQLAHQILAQRGGGWPLTVFLAPEDLTPFFAGTYFPREPRYGMPAFREVLERVAQFHSAHGAELRQQNGQLQEVFQRLNRESPPPAETLTTQPINEALGVLLKNFDPRDGGFGRAPKFPHTSDLELLLQTTADEDTDAESRQTCRHMALLSLRRMAQGGIYDHLGGGFCRYSVDNSWTIPHFEKMLYDNGPLLGLYAQAWKLSGESLFRETAEQTAAWAMREMQGPQGGYYSSLDADSEGHEGKFYVWDRDEIKALLTEAEFTALAPRYGLDDEANFEGRWNLRIALDLARNSQMLPMDEPTRELLASARGKLLAARSRRVRPGLDDKVLTAWNGLMIHGMALAGGLLEHEDYVDSAVRAAEFIRARLWIDGRLRVSWRAGQAKLPGYLDDYAFLLDGLLQLLQQRWNRVWFDWAQEIAEQLLRQFEDRERGGFWFTAADQTTPLHRPKNFSDESMPAGNGLAARALLTLGHLCAEPRYLDAAERALKAAFPALTQYPESHAGMLLALDPALQPPTMLVLRGKPVKLRAWRLTLAAHFDPRRITLALTDDADVPPGLLAQCLPRGEICAYLCRGTSCSLPITELSDLMKML